MPEEKHAGAAGAVVAHFDTGFLRAVNANFVTLSTSLLRRNDGRRGWEGLAASGHPYPRRERRDEGKSQCGVVVESDVDACDMEPLDM